MASFSHYSLQKAVYQALTGNTGFMALVTGIYDRPPQETVFPYVTIGEAVISDWSSATTSGTEQVISIHAWSREGGRKQAVSIMEKIYATLHDANFSVEGHTLVMIRFAGSSVTLENDGFTYQGQMKFRAYLESSS